jgi:hypothetical protein
MSFELTGKSVTELRELYKEGEAPPRDVVSAVSVPISCYTDGPIFSVSVIGDAFDDTRIAAIADAIHDDGKRYED